MKIGDIITFEHTFTTKDVELFTEVSCDEGVHHITPDEQGRLVIQGLLSDVADENWRGCQCIGSDNEF